MKKKPRTPHSGDRSSADLSCASENLPLFLEDGASSICPSTWTYLASGKSFFLSRGKKAAHKGWSVFKKIRTGEAVFLRRVLILLSGSVLAQALPIAVAPLLSRLFSPELMGLWGLYAAVAAVGGTLATLRYESALLLPKDDLDAAALLLLATGSSLIFALFVTGLLAPGGGFLLTLSGLGPIRPYWGWIPAGVALMAFFQVLSVWSIRSLRFSTLAAARISQSATLASIQVVAGLARTGAIGLLAGQVLGQVLSVSVLLRELCRKDLPKFASVDRARIKRAAVSYIRFPLFSLPADLSNILANYLPLFLLGVYFGPAIVGFYTLTQRVLAAPAALVGNAVLDVFKERAAADYRELGSCRRLYRKTFLALSVLSVPPSLLLFLFAPPLFAFVFGEEWREAGEYARLLSPLLLVRFVASPLSYVLYIAQKQNVDLIWQVCLLIVGVVTIVAGSQLSSPRMSIGLFSAGFSVMYVIYLVLSYLYAKSGKESH